MTNDGTTNRLRSSKAEQPIRNRPGVRSIRTGASTYDGDVIPPPSTMTVTETTRQGVYDATGRLWTRRTGF